MNKKLQTAIWTALVALLLAAAGSYIMYVAAVPSAAEQIPYTLYSLGGLAFAGFAVTLGFAIYNAVKYNDERQRPQYSLYMQQ